MTRVGTLLFAPFSFITFFCEEVGPNSTKGFNMQEPSYNTGILAHKELEYFVSVDPEEWLL